MQGQAADPGPVDAAVGGEGAVAGDTELAAVRVPGQQQVVAVGREQVHHRGLGGVQHAEPEVGGRVGRSCDRVVAVPVGVRVVHPGQGDIEAAGGSIVARALDARKEDEVAAFLDDADRHAPLEVCIFNVGANVNFPILETTDRVFRKVWEMACWAGFLAGRESARLMLPRGQGNIFFTGDTASLRGGSGFAAFASAKFGLRAVAQSMARELGPQNIHVAHLIIDSGVDTAWVRERREQLWGKEALNNPDLLMPPASVAASYWQLYQQPRSAWTFELEIRPFGEKW